MQAGIRLRESAMRCSSWPTLALVLAGCAAPGTDDADGREVLQVNPVPPGDPPRALIPGSAAFAAQLRELGSDLAGHWYTGTNWFDGTTLSRWTDWMARLGLSYPDPGGMLEASSDKRMNAVWFNRAWGIEPYDGGDDGWTLRELWKPLDEAFSDTAEWRSVRLTAHERRLLW